VEPKIFSTVSVITDPTIREQSLLFQQVWPHYQRQVPADQQDDENSFRNLQFPPHPEKKHVWLVSKDAEGRVTGGSVMTVIPKHGTAFIGYHFGSPEAMAQLEEEAAKVAVQTIRTATANPAASAQIIRDVMIPSRMDPGYQAQFQVQTGLDAHTHLDFWNQRGYAPLATTPYPLIVDNDGAKLDTRSIMAVKTVTLDETDKVKALPHPEAYASKPIIDTALSYLYGSKGNNAVTIAQKFEEKGQSVEAAAIRTVGEFQTANATLPISASFVEQELKARPAPVPFASHPLVKAEVISDLSDPAQKASFREAYKIYEGMFPEDERDSYKDLFKSLQANADPDNATKVAWIVARDKKTNKAIGATIITTVPEEGIATVGFHFTTLRRKGVGTFLEEAAQIHSIQSIREATGNKDASVLMLADIENPLKMDADVIEEATKIAGITPQERLKFWRQRGFLPFNGFPYILIAQAEGAEPTYNLDLHAKRVTLGPEGNPTQVPVGKIDSKQLTEGVCKWLYGSSIEDTPGEFEDPAHVKALQPMLTWHEKNPQAEVSEELYNEMIAPKPAAVAAPALVPPQRADRPERRPLAGSLPRPAKNAASNPAWSYANFRTAAIAMCTAIVGLAVGAVAGYNLAPANKGQPTAGKPTAETQVSKTTQASIVQAATKELIRTLGLSADVETKFLSRVDAPDADLKALVAEARGLKDKPLIQDNARLLAENAALKTTVGGLTEKIDEQATELEGQTQEIGRLKKAARQQRVRTPRHVQRAVAAKITSQAERLAQRPAVNYNMSWDHLLRRGGPNGS
jgi:hypothetical protein